MESSEYSRRKFLRQAGFAAAAVSAGELVNLIGCTNDRSDLPNVVLIFTDDQGYADVGCYGAEGFETPNIDTMAAEGIRFTNFYVSQAVCSASRAALMTGCYSERVSIRGALNSWSQVGLNPEEETIAEVLKKEGYSTGIFGKWHLGLHKDFLPLQRGFDEYFGLPYSNDMWPYDYHGNSLKEGRKSLYPPLYLIEGNEKTEEISDLDRQAELTTMYTERAVAFIDKNKDRPFFLYLPHTMPHTPLAVSDKFKGKSGKGVYGDVMMEIDWSVGEILKNLEKHGLDENTLVIFTSDNGPWLNFSQHGGSAQPLREGKGTMWEGGPRVPCIMRWPKKIKAGSVCDQIASTIDFLPTLAAVTGAPLPEKKIDGVSILPILEGDDNAVPRDHFFYYFGGNLIAVRKGKWKLVFPHSYPVPEDRAQRDDGMPGKQIIKRSDLELYDLENDIGETVNVISGHSDVVRDLEELAEEARDELGDFLTNRRGKGVREPGRIGGRRSMKTDHLAVGMTVNYNNPYHVKYPAGGDDGLVNGIQGSTDFNDGCWQGFEGNDMDVVVDLGSVQNVKEVLCSFLQVQVSWIFLPEKVEISISSDGEEYSSAGSFVNETGSDPEIKIQENKADVEGKEARFIRIHAESVGTCPEWHPGAGGKCWIFSDEVVVK